jgi:hypothetical protein
MALFRRVTYSVGMMIRETGQALDRVGSNLQGIYAYKEQRESEVLDISAPRCL